MINRYNILNGAKYLAEEGPQNYFLFQTLIKYFKLIRNIVVTWKSKGLSDESITAPATSLNLRLDYFINLAFRVEFNGSYLKTDSEDFNHKRINLHISYGIKSWRYYTNNGFVLRNSLFGGFKLTKIMVLKSILILDMIFHLIHVELFNSQMKLLVKTY